MSPQFTWNDFYEEMYKAMDVSLVKELCEDEDGVVDKILPVVEPAVRFGSTRFFPTIENQKMFMKVYIDSIVHRPKVVLNQLVTRDRHEEVRRKFSNKPIVIENTAVIRKGVKLALKIEEIEALKSSRYPVGYALLGVVKQQMSRPEIVIKKHDLMLPNPKDQCNYFNAFWKYCAEKKRVLFCSYRHSKRCQPSFCEMMPKIVNNKCCFLIKYLYFFEDCLVDPESPFDDEEEPVVAEPSDATVSNIRKLVDALTFPYDPMAFYDVQSAKEEAYVRAQALDQRMEDVADLLDNKDKINKVLDDLGLVQKRVAEVKDEKLSKPRGSASRKKVKSEK